MRTAPLLLFATLVISSGCGVTAPSAIDYARRACRDLPGPPSAPTDSPVSDQSPAKTLAGYEKSARLAAKAAELDPRWDALNRAYSTLVDSWHYVVTLPTDGDGEPEQDQINMAELQRIVRRATAAEATVRAECRKTD